MCLGCSEASGVQVGTGVETQAGVGSQGVESLGKRDISQQQ